MTATEAVARQWDAVVVGAGPAGAVAARELARRGRRVLVVDKATFPRNKVCGCCLNGSALATLRRAGLGDLLTTARAVPLTTARIVAGGQSARVRLPVGGVTLSREAFDVALIDAATAAGAVVLLGTPAKVDAGRVSLAAGPVRAGVAVVASGLAGVVAAGSRVGGGATAGAVPGYPPGTVHLMVGRGGYVGAVRLEDGRLDLAATLDAGFVKAAGGLGPAAARVLAEAGAEPVPKIERLPWKGTPALTRRPARVAGPDWLAAGDAGGYVEPFTGEGMAWALASGLAAGRLAADWSPARAAEWERFFARRLRPRQRVCRAAAAALRRPRLSTLVVGLLRVAPVLAGPVVAALNRPFPADRGS